MKLTVKQIEDIYKDFEESLDKHSGLKGYDEQTAFELITPLFRQAHDTVCLFSKDDNNLEIDFFKHANGLNVLTIIKLNYLSFYVTHSSNEVKFVDCKDRDFRLYYHSTGIKGFEAYQSKFYIYIADAYYDYYIDLSHNNPQFIQKISDIIRSQNLSLACELHQSIYNEKS